MGFKRVIAKPSKSFFLLGPRGTGKSTWLRTLKFDLTIDLLHSRERLVYLQDPTMLVERTSHLKAGDWVLIDEVQKVPELLEEVHSIYEAKKINFALSGSSARKLKRTGVNLLAGRAINKKMFPLIYAEYSQASFEIDELVDWGTLPLVVDNIDNKRETLSTYVDNYLRQELVEEGIIRKLEPFVRFLSAAGQLNGQILNVENVAREAKVKRPSVDKYFEVLCDTLVGFRLPAYQPNIRINESAHPKFFFFDSGVARAAAGYIYEELDQAYRGFLFETFLLNEVRVYNEYAEKHRDIFYYSVRSSGDVDVVVQLAKRNKSSPDKILAIEFKLGSSWRSEWAKSLQILDEDKGKTIVTRSILVYTGSKFMRQGSIEVYPVESFLKLLHGGELF